MIVVDNVKDNYLGEIKTRLIVSRLFSYFPMSRQIMNLLALLECIEILTNLSQQRIF